MADSGFIRHRRATSSGSTEKPFGDLWSYHCREIGPKAKHKCYRKNTLKSPLNKECLRNDWTQTLVGISIAAKKADLARGGQ